MRVALIGVGVKSVEAVKTRTTERMFCSERFLSPQEAICTCPRGRKAGRLLIDGGVSPPRVTVKRLSG